MRMHLQHELSRGCAASKMEVRQTGHSSDRSLSQGVTHSSWYKWLQGSIFTDWPSSKPSRHTAHLSLCAPLSGDEDGGSASKGTTGRSTSRCWRSRLARARFSEFRQK